MPNFSVYSWLINGYCFQCNEEEVLKLLDDFFERGLSEDVFYIVTLFEVRKPEKGQKHNQ